MQEPADFRDELFFGKVAKKSLTWARATVKLLLISDSHSRRDVSREKDGGEYESSSRHMVFSP